MAGAVCRMRFALEFFLSTVAFDVINKHKSLKLLVTNSSWLPHTSIGILSFGGDSINSLSCSGVQ